MGHAFDLNNIIKNNRALKQRAHIKYEKVRMAYHKVNARYPEFIDKKKFTKKESELFKRKIRAEIIRDEKRSIILTLIISLVILLSGVLYLTNRFDFF